MSHKAFIRRFFMLSAAALCVHLLFFEWYTRVYIVPEDSIAMQEKRLLENSDSIRVIALGDSHTADGFKPESVAFFNFGRGSDSMPIEYFKLKYAMKNIPNLKTVIIEADYHQFSYYMTTYAHYRQYARYVDEPVPAELGKYPAPRGFRFFFVSLEENYSPIIYRHLYNKLTGHPTQEKKRDISADRWIDRPIAVRDRLTRDRVDVQLYNRYLVNPGFVRHLERMINMALDGGVRVILLRYPMSAEYLEMVDQSVEREIDGLYAAIKSRYNVTILDRRRIFAERQSFFRDMDHLNAPGARVLTKDVVSELGGQDAM